MGHKPYLIRVRDEKLRKKCVDVRKKRKLEEER